MNIVITSGVRTPIGKFGGSLAGISAAELASISIREALSRSGVSPQEVDEVLIGNVLQAGQGQNPARQAAIKAGIPVEVPSTTINKVCGSGLKSVTMGVQAIRCDDASIIVAGGTENMSRAPYLLTEARFGYRLGHGELIDSMISDGLSCAMCDVHMGTTAENIAKKYNISRSAQDEFAALSQRRAVEAIQNGLFKREIVAVQIPGRKGEVKTFDTDEYPRAESTLESLSKLKPAFDDAGSVTAGNASARQAKQPFFYYVNFFDPHGPYTPELNQVAGIPEKPVRADEVTEPYPLRTPTEAAQKRVTATIINTIRRVDAGVGLLLDELQAAGFAGNTLVVFLGDNGLPVIRGKTWCYEPGVRVPLLMRGPGVPSGLVRSDLASAVDLMPTILRAAGLAVPEGVAGQPLLPNSTRALLFTEMNFHEPQILRVQRTVRNEQFKLLLNLTPMGEQAPVELFDLRTDPGETKNLADDPACADVRRRLEAALQTWREETGDPTLDAARVRRWQEAAARWGQLPKVAAGPNMVVHIPAGELNLLK